MVVEVLLLSEPRFSAAELELEEDAPLALLGIFPLGKDLWHRQSSTIRIHTCDTISFLVTITIPIITRYKKVKLIEVATNCKKISLVSVDRFRSFKCLWQKKEDIFLSNSTVTLRFQLFMTIRSNKLTKYTGY